jgi:glycosyltransferase involved in cell wall biosynthesis
MVPLEINASGRPVIAYRAGGALETVVDGKTGMFFDRQTVDSVAGAIEEFESRAWNRRLMRRHAERFDNRVFSERMSDFIAQVAPASCAREIVPTRKSASFGAQKVPAI